MYLVFIIKKRFVFTCHILNILCIYKYVSTFYFISLWSNMITHVETHSFNQMQWALLLNVYYQTLL